MKDDDLDGLLERMVPGSGHRSLTDTDAPSFPLSLGLTPLGVLARGSVGWVFRAEDPLLDRVVAVKISRPEQGGVAREAMLAEARTTARLAHPAVLPVHRIVAADGLLCVVFALGPDTTLAHRGADPDWARDDRLACFHVVVDALAHAHQLGIVHGDLTPANVAVDAAGHPYVLDWSGLTGGEGTFSGTPGFAAPEQLAGGDPSAAGDVYALASLAWELMGSQPLRRPPRGQESVAAYVAHYAQASVAPPPLPGIDPDLAGVLRAAASADPAVRPGVAALATAVQRARTGQAESERRHRQAETELAVARRRLVAFRDRERRVEAEKRVIAVQRGNVPPHAPPEAKEALWATQGRVAALLDDQAEAWTEALEHAVTAAHLAPEVDEAHAIIAELWWERMRMAEARGYVGEGRLARARVQRHDRGRFAGLMGAEAWLSLAGHGEVTIHQVVASGHRAVAGPGTRHPLPLDRLPLAPGSWILQIAEERISVWLDRLEHLSLEPVPMPSIAGFCPVPAGPFRMGGDEGSRQAVDSCVPWLTAYQIARLPVTSADYLAFLATLPADGSTAYAPAQTLVSGQDVALWPDGRLPAGWDPRRPVVGIPQAAARAYADHLGLQLGHPVRLPTEEEWEKAARGADGRLYPWGSGFDPAWCHMGDSLPGPSRLGPVGAFETDRSPYGVRDLAGGIREWTTSVLGADRAVVRGGSYRSDAVGCRAACRAGLSPDARASDVGIRLVISSLPSGPPR